MIEHLFIAEKPSLAGEVAAARAKQTGHSSSKANGYWQVGPDAVTWLFGHMYEQAPPDHYDPRYKNWSIQDLPIIPGKWVILPRGDHAGRIREVQGLIRNASKIVNVGDAAREGQLLVDELLFEAGRNPFGPDVLRLWLQDLTEQKKIEALEHMLPNAQKRDLYEAALGRQRADWLLGMNMTRLYTSLARRAGLDRGVISVGRVQTPTLRLVVDRDREIAKFRAVDHYLPAGYFRHANGTFKASWIIPAEHDGLDSEGRLVDKTVAERIANKVAGKSGRIDSFEVKKKAKAPPLPFDLPALQKELSAKLGLTAQQTLDVAQSLYETHKVTSYPRTESQYLPSGIFTDEAAGIMANLGGVPAYAPLVAKANLKLKSPAFNDSKVTDHYAIIPTAEATAAKIAGLPDLERKAFQIIALRFISQFYPDYRWDSLTATLTIEGERFRATGNNVTDKGWRAVYEAVSGQADKDEDEDEDEQALPAMARSDAVTAEKMAVDAKRTTPPSKFTDGTLTEAMRSIHRFVSDPEAKKRLKESSGIGTAATRANIIETLVARKFLARNKKFIESTPLGREVIDILAEQLTDPVLTAVWEEKLEGVANGEIKLDDFLSSLISEVSGLVSGLADKQIKLNSAPKPLAGTGQICPQCGKGHLITRTVAKGPSKGKQFLACDAYDPNNADSCRFAKWPESPGEKVKPLPGDGEICPQCGKGHLVTRVVMKAGPHKGKRFLACDSYDQNNPDSCRYSAWEQIKMTGDGEICPKCGKGHLVTRTVTKDGPNKGKQFLVCSEGSRDDPSSCSFVKWPETKVSPLPGDGQTCSKCGKGKMVTRMVTKDGPNKGQRFLSCNAYDPKGAGGCNHSEWPQASGKPSNKPVAGAKTMGRAGLGRRL